MQKASKTTFTERLKLAIDQSGLLQQDVARMAKLTPGALTLWLNGGTKTHKADALLRVAKALHVRPEWLLWDEGPMRQPAVAEPAAELIETMPADTRARVLDYAEYDLTKSIASDPRKLGHYLRLIDKIKNVPKE